MRIRRVEARNFRNYGELRFEPVEGLNFVVGENASGKTNLLEAIYLAAYGRGFRAADAELLKFGEKAGDVKANFDVSGGVLKTVRIELGRKSKAIFLGNKRLSRRQDLVGQFPVVLSGAWDFEIAAGDPGARRRYIDGLLGLLSPAYLVTVRDYARALRQRNLLLNEFREAAAETLREKLRPWTESLIGYGSIIGAKREALVEELSQRVSERYRAIAGTDEEVELTYRPNVAPSEGSYAEGLRAAFNRLFEKERQRGLTLAGPHLDELVVRVGGVELRRYGSRGEQKTAILALRVAQVEIIAEKRGEQPVLLVDDVFSDLDIGRAERFLNTLAGLQVVATSAEEERVRQIVERSGRGSAVFQVREGKIYGEAS